MDFRGGVTDCLAPRRSARILLQIALRRFPENFGVEGTSYGHRGHRPSCKAETVCAKHPLANICLTDFRSRTENPPWRRRPWRHLARKAPSSVGAWSPDDLLCTQRGCPSISRLQKTLVEYSRAGGPKLWATSQLQVGRKAHGAAILKIEEAGTLERGKAVRLFGLRQGGKLPFSPL